MLKKAFVVLSLLMLLLLGAWAIQLHTEHRVRLECLQEDSEFRERMQRILHDQNRQLDKMLLQLRNQ